MVDRLFGVLCILLTLLSAVGIFTEASFSWSWVLLIVWTIGLGLWTANGWFKKDNNLPVGYQGQFLCFGSRIPIFCGEGRRFAPTPLRVKPEDCRAKTTKLDDVKALTSDNIEVSISDPTILWEIFSLRLFLNLNPENLPELLDNVVDENIRQQIRLTSYDEVARMKFNTKSNILEEFGIRVLKLKVSDTLPTDEAMLKDIQLKASEGRQREGQRTQARHHAELVTFFSGTGQLGDEGPKGPGLSPELANEAALIHMDKTEKKKLASSTFGLDANTVKTIVETVLGGRRP